MRLPLPDQWFWPDWRPHRRVRAVVTTRAGKHSPPPWDGFNLGANCGDDPQRVERARQYVQQALSTDHPPHWLNQVHGTSIVSAGQAAIDADGVWTRDSGRPCVVLTADCLPVLLARQDGSAVAALHAGWRGLLDGILEAGVARLSPGGEPLSAWIGPAISQRAYQVGSEIRDAFVAEDAATVDAFVADASPGHWRMSLVAIASLRLARAGVTDIQGGDMCTASDTGHFYSWRREGQTGRFASLIWLE